MKISGNEIKHGMLIEHKNDLWEVLKTQHVKPGKGGAFNQVEMKSVNKGTKLNERFRSSDTVEKASIDEINFNYLYEDESEYHFIDQKTFEQINILHSINKITRTPLVAIGGINSKNYKKLLLNKANFLAISGYIWNNKKYKPSEAIKRIK